MTIPVLSYLKQISDGVRTLPQILTLLSALKVQQDGIASKLEQLRAEQANRATEIFGCLTTLIQGEHVLIDQAEEILRRIGPSEPQAIYVEFVFEFGAGNSTIVKTGETMQLPRNSTVTGTIKAYDSPDPATRNEAPIENPKFTLTGDEGVHTMVVDGTTVTITAGPKAGSSLLAFEGDGKIGDGVSLVVASANILTPPGEAVVAEMTFTDPVPAEQPAGGGDDQGGGGQPPAPPAGGDGGQQQP